MTNNNNSSKRLNENNSRITNKLSNSLGLTENKGNNGNIHQGPLTLR